MNDQKRASRPEFLRLRGAPHLGDLVRALHRPSRERAAPPGESNALGIERASAQIVRRGGGSGKIATRAAWFPRRAP
jgi:hypothetical protein